MTDICKVCLKAVKISDMAILCDHCDNWIHIKCNILINLIMKCLKVQWTRDSVFLAFRIFYPSAIGMEKLKKQLPYLQTFFTIMNFLN